MPRTPVILLALALSITAAFRAAAQEVAVSQLLDRLHRPSGIAIRPDGTPQQFEIYFSDFLDRQINRIRSDSPQVVTPAITKFPTESGGALAGPAGLLFLDRNRLVVTFDGGLGNTNLSLFELKDEQPLTAELAVQKLPLGAASDPSLTASLNVISLTRTLSNDRVPDLIIAAARGGDGGAGLWKIPIRAGTLDKPTPFVATTPQPPIVASAISTHGFLVVASTVQDAATTFTRLTFYNPIDSRKAMELRLDLENVRALAYSPRTGNLYAANYGTESSDFTPTKTGIFRIDDASKPDEPACKAVKIAEVLRPTAFAFGPDGALYVTADGNTLARTSRNGLLVKLSGEL